MAERNQIDQTSARGVPEPSPMKRDQLTPEVIETILKDRSNRMQELLEVGKFEDAVSIGEEFDEWLTDMMN